MELKELNWIEEAVARTLIARCPEGFSVNEKAIKGLTKSLIRTGGTCPCSHKEWTDDTPDEDKKCPCVTFRKDGVCHCGLYI